MKNMVIYLLVFAIIAISFIAPTLLLKKEVSNIEKRLYDKNKTENNLDIEAEKLYLVKAIHGIQNGYVQVVKQNSEYVSSENLIENNEKLENITKEWDSLIKNNILTKNFEGTKTIVSKVQYAIDKEIYRIYDTLIDVGNEKMITFQFEEKTGKILFANFAKDYLNKNYSKEEILINYVKYLDLYIIGDWYYEDNLLKSDKAKLVVNLAELSDRYILTIRSTEKYISIVDSTLYTESETYTK